jgi:superoxide reductase
MDKLGEYVKTADWKSEKHVPAIEAPATAKAGEYVSVSASVGKQIAHPNTTEHHLCWIALHFVPDGGKASFEIGRYEFSAHGQSPNGPNLGPVFADSCVTTRVRLTVSGTIYATAYCNIHGLWESFVPVQVA